jgi:hypothetical protein
MESSKRESNGFGNAQMKKKRRQVAALQKGTARQRILPLLVLSDKFSLTVVSIFEARVQPVAEKDCRAVNSSKTIHETTRNNSKQRFS